MNDVVNASSSDPTVERLKLSRNSDAVLKLRLVQFRSYCPHVPVFAFEGDDDKIVYAQWVRRSRPELYYEPFPCSGKTAVLALRSLAQRDLNGIGNGLYYFVDRDFDELRGSPSGDDVFLTESYSVENYLASPEVVDQILCNELHCHGRPDVRLILVRNFEERYAEFLEVTQDINRRIYVARKTKTEITRHLPTSISAIASVTLESVTAGNADVAKLVPLETDIPEELSRTLGVEFAALDRALRYRGKFALMFLSKWLEHMTCEYSSSRTKYFKDIPRKGRPRVTEFTIGRFDSKYQIPEGLPGFLEKI